MSARWIHDGVVKAGPYCTAQGMLYSSYVQSTSMFTRSLCSGVIQQLGETSVGLATMVCSLSSAGYLHLLTRLISSLLSIHS